MKAKICLFFCGVLINLSAWCQPVFDGYEAYYRTRNGIFNSDASFPIAGGTRNIIVLDGKRLALNRAHAFPKEHTSVDLGHWAVAYRATSFACIEGQSASASGTAVRYQSVYLVDLRQTNREIVYKLPSLFGTCVGVRVNARMEPLFDRAEYIYEKGSDQPAGVTLLEFAIAKGKFERTGHFVAVQFVEPGNVYKFQVTDIK
ncbi:hypothetical protein [Massilia sp. TWR1-2-2]|uniref:hypothetical protein n=1 Tax=Massilia sp. TWR1-2-2 TaxID=2804584 RepID=UPI003CEE0C5D